MAGSGPRAGLPRLAPAVIARPNIDAWLANYAQTPLRILAAPAGSGKTTAAVAYLAQRPSATAYARLSDGDDAAKVRSRIGRALGVRTTDSYEALIDTLADAAPIEVCVDDADRASPEALEELNRLVADAPSNVGLIYLVRSRLGLDANELLSRGLAALLDATALAFEADDVSRLATLLGVAHAPADAAGLVQATDGWPIVACAAVRECVDANTTLAGAFARWSERGARHFARFLAAELERSTDFDLDAFARLVASPDASDVHLLESLEERGLFVRFVGGAYRPYRVVAQLAPAGGRAEIGAPKDAPIMFVRMFGRFEAVIDGRPVAWIRRRDAQLVKYLMLRPSGTASRAELRQTFWPDTDFGLATQSLRTACSNIRKAIAAVVGYEDVERYFQARGDVTVNLAQTALDVRRFSAHVGDGDAELEHGNAQEARAHYAAAERLYSGELLGGEPPEPWYAARAEMFKALYIGVLQRLADLSADAGYIAQTGAYRERLRSLESPGDPARPAHFASVGAPTIAAS